MHQAILLAGGVGKRWELHRPKHYLEIDGERLIQRTIRMAQPLFDDLVVAVPHAGYIHDAREFIVPDHLRRPEQQKILSSKEEWSSARTTLLYGDVYYTPAALQSFAESTQPLVFLLRHDESDATGKPHGEIYGIAFAESLQKKIMTAMDGFTHVDGIPDRAGWWLWHCLQSAATAIVVEDETEDFDSLEDYRRWCERRG